MAAVYGLLQVALYVSSGSRDGFYRPLVTLALVAFLLGIYGYAERRSLTTATLVFVFGLNALGVGLSLLTPEFYPVTVFVPLVVIGVALPLLRPPWLLRTIVASWLIALGMVAIGITMPPRSPLPPIYTSVVLVTALGFGLGLLMLIWYQYAQRTTESLGRMQEVNEDLQRISVEAAELVRTRTQFFSNAAHELRTPLTPITVQAHLLGERLERGDDPELKRFMAILSRNLHRLNDLVEDLLEAARAQSGRLPIRPLPADLAKVARESLESFQSTAKENAVALQISGADSLPSVTDPSRVRQVLDNLLANALRFTPEGGRIDLELEQRDGNMHFRVRDTGIGFEPMQRKRLFQPFVQVHEDPRFVGKGAGLGLYISAEVAKALGGHLDGKSDGMNRGATFELRIPINAPA